MTRLILGLLSAAVLLPGPATASPTFEAPPARAAAHTLRLTGLTQGPAPRMPYARASEVDFNGGDWRLVRTDGTTVRLPRGTWGTFAPMGRGAVGMLGTEAGPELQVVDGAGKVVRDQLVPAYGLAVTPDRSVVAWIGQQDRVYETEHGGRRTSWLAAVPDTRSIGAIWGSGTCQESYPEGGGCSALVNRTGHRVSVTTSHGIVDGVPHVRQVADITDDGRFLARARRDGRTCWGLRGIGGHEHWRHCGLRLDSFDPTGRLVLGLSRSPQWESVDRIAMLGRGGRTRVAWSFSPGRHQRIEDVRWEDRHHLLAEAYHRGHWSLVRLGLDGSASYAVAPRRGAIDVSNVQLPLR